MLSSTQRSWRRQHRYPLRQVTPLHGFIAWLHFFHDFTFYLLCNLLHGPLHDCIVLYGINVWLQYSNELHGTLHTIDAFWHYYCRIQGCIFLCSYIAWLHFCMDRIQGGIFSMTALQMLHFCMAIFHYYIFAMAESPTCCKYGVIVTSTIFFIYIGLPSSKHDRLIQHAFNILSWRNFLTNRYSGCVCTIALHVRLHTVHILSSEVVYSVSYYSTVHMFSKISLLCVHLVNSIIFYRKDNSGPMQGKFSDINNTIIYMNTVQT
jgi:hypothetical protein